MLRPAGNHSRLGEFVNPWKTVGVWIQRVQDCGMEFAEVTCPTCFEVFEVAVPHPDEMPTEVDYDCEVCCRPMVIVFTEDDVYARGLAD
jgi:phage FluMu protein Com